MLNKPFISILFLLFFSFFASAQDDKNKNEVPKELVIDKTVKVNEEINPIAPAKAAFYSAVLPGLGQAYNKQYWKIPVVYVALGTGVYFYTANNKEYNRYRDAYKSRIAGFETDEFYFDSKGNKLSSPRVTTQSIELAQKYYRKNKELSLLVTIGMYALNIIDANVGAHLLQFNVDENLSLTPYYDFNHIDATANTGLTLNIKF